MATNRLEDLERRLAEANERLEQENLKLGEEEIRLADLRQRLEIAQTDLAHGLEVSQSAISQLERSKDMRISTLRKYLEGIGATLELRAVFGNGGMVSVSIVI